MVADLPLPAACGELVERRQLVGVGAFHSALLDQVAAGEAFTSSLVLPVLTDLG